MALKVANDVRLKAQEIYEAALAMDPDELEKKADEDKFFFARVVMGNVPVFPDKLDPEEAKDWVKLFNFDYKEDLIKVSRERERVFTLSKFELLGGSLEQQQIARKRTATYEKMLQQSQRRQGNLPP